MLIYRARGLTPSYAVIQECTERIKVPIRVIVRHRDADFYCPADEYFQLKKDITKRLHPKK
ncbi:copper homeostasis protein CutC [Spiroplasma endosymbiont of Megaselia nigra]|uniref:copper homeostasis protein CutC n=1 Tax=Spiroplasma endosymbiont of Megaselia nigra TaxID=2478537 RepID=UPI001F4EA38D|nr:copper homeostasis protein CutC [Spiroplasma endosymbiont of Megaselia nigra]